MNQISHSAVSVIFALCVLFVAFVQGVFNPFVLWNLVPVVIGYVWIRLVLKKKAGERARAAAWPAIGYGAVSAAVVLLFHIIWQIDLDGFATGSSTSGIIFIFIPLYAVACGLAGSLVGLLAKVIYVKAAKQ